MGSTRAKAAKAADPYPLNAGCFVDPFAMVTAVLAGVHSGGPVLTCRFEKKKD